jgi:hypothetical protein
VHDPALTRDSFRGEAPFGEALRAAGPRASAWEFGRLGQDVTALGLAGLLDRLGPESASFEDARKITGARVTVRLRDGTTATRRRDIPLGAAGPHTRAHHAELVREKFLATGGPVAVADALADLREVSAPLLDRMVAAALRPPFGMPHSTTAAAAGLSRPPRARRPDPDRAIERSEIGDRR